MQQATTKHLWTRIQPYAVISIGLVVLLAVVRWGGTARPGPLFVAGTALVIGIIGLFGAIGVWLYLSPLPPGVVVAPSVSSEARRLVALLVPIAGVLFSIGGVWDEAWHIRYGGFGDDFLWPPHFLIYSSIALIALFGFGGMALVLRGGDVRARFRADPLLGLIGLVSTMLMASLPADQLWHSIYGVDMTAWSLPHIWIVVGVSSVMLSAASLQLAFVPRRPWQGLTHLSSSELLLFALFGSAIFAMLQVGVTEWNSIDIIPVQLISGDGFKDAFWSRPEWLYPVVITALALWSANLALHTTRRAGAATVVALLVALVRTLAALLLLRGEGTTIAFQSFWFLLPPAIALDLWYARRLRMADSTQTLVVGNILAIVGGLLVNLPIIASTMVYPRVNATTVPWMIGMSLLVGVGAGWAGAQLGSWLASRPRTDVGVPAPARSRLIAAATGLLATAYTLVVLLAARPPTA